MSQSRTSPPDLFRERLRAVRDQRGFSQDDLAKRAGLQASAVSHFETGTRKPSFDNLRRLADALEVTTDYLVGRAAHDRDLINTMVKNFERLTAHDRDLINTMVNEMAKKLMDAIDV